MNNGNKEKLKNKLIKTIILTIILLLISIYCLHKIAITHDALFNDINAVPFWLLLIICIIVIYTKWLFYAEAYSKLMINKKYRSLPLIILVLIGIIVTIIFVTLSLMGI